MMHFNIFFPFKAGAGGLSNTRRRILYRNAWPPEGWRFVDFHIHSCRGPSPRHGMLRFKKRNLGNKRKSHCFHKSVCVSLEHVQAILIIIREPIMYCMYEGVFTVWGQELSDCHIIILGGSCEYVKSF